MKKALTLFLILINSLFSANAEEITVWENESGLAGNLDFTVGSDLHTTLMSTMEAGSIMTIYYKDAGESNQKLLIQNSGWNTYPNEIIGVTTDLLSEGDGTYKLVTTQAFIDRVSTEGLKLRRGGSPTYSFTKISISSDVVVWEGSQSTSLYFTTSNNSEKFAIMKASLSVGDKIRFWYSDAVESTQIWLQSNWSGITIEENNCPTLSVGDGSYTFTILGSALSQITNNGLLIIIGGGSCTLTKVEIIKAESGMVFPGSSEIILWSGSDNSNSFDFRYDPLASKLIAADIQHKDTLKIYLNDVETDDYIQIKEAGGDWGAMNIHRTLSTDQQVYKLPIAPSMETKISNNKFLIQRQNDNGSKTYDYEVRYITVAKHVQETVPGYEVLFDNPEGVDIAWGNGRYVQYIDKEKLGNLTAGDNIHVYWRDYYDKGKYAICRAGGTTTIRGSVSFNSTTPNPIVYSNITSDEITTIEENDLVISGYYYYLLKVVLEHPSRFTSVTMNSDGLSTFGHTTEAIDCSWFESLGLKAYTATISGDRIVTTKVTEAVPAGTGLILQGEPSTTYKLPFASGADAVVGNVLQPTTGDNVTGYVLAKDATQGIGFYKVTNKAVPAGKAYIADLGAARYFAIDFLDDEPTSIKNAPITKHTAVQEAYNFMGQRVAANSKGLVIINGKKVFNK